MAEMIRKERQTRKLMVKLSAEEMAGLSEELVGEELSAAEKEAEKREVTKDLTEAIKGHRSEIRRLVALLNKGEEEREVDCEKTLDYDNLVVMVIRNDTAEVVETREMSDIERQMQLAPL